ncbi:MAG: hypothetical protein JNL89_00360 [Rhodanobacteraceae bacterium]|nr:hypothetical protein [Rhodanobacteraceae bacterium]
MTLMRMLVTLLALVAGSRADALATIGSDANCTYGPATVNPVQVAFNAGHTDIRLTGGLSYTGSLVLAGNADVSIRGGYSNCAAAAAGQLPSNPVRSILQPGVANGTAVILVESAQRRRLVTLELVEIRPNAALGTAGGGLAVGGALDATLVRSRVTGFRSAGDGGGVAISLGRLTLVRSSIDDNRGRDGGGVNCNSGEVLLDFASSLRANQANSNGGGAYLDQCNLVSNGRNLPGTQGGPAGVLDNRANGRGGGLYQRGGFTSIAGGPVCTVNPGAACSTQLALLSGNRAEVSGGGAFLTAQAELEAMFSQIANNSAILTGGGFHAEQQSQLRIGGFAGDFPGFDRSTCLNRICDAVFSNRLGAADDSFLSGEGGAIYGQDAFITLRDVFLTDHRALSGTVAYNRGSGVLTLEQSLVVQAPRQGDTGQDMLRVGDTADLDLRDSTIIGQRAGEVSLLRADQSTDVLINRSVVAALANGLSALSAGPQVAVLGDCNAQARGTHPVFDGPTVTAADFDAEYAPSGNSQLVDGCSGAGARARDIRGNPRVQAQSAASGSTPMDIGAFELGTQALFGNGFE